MRNILKQTAPWVVLFSALSISSPSWSLVGLLPLTLWPGDSKPSEPAPEPEPSPEPSPDSPEASPESPQTSLIKAMWVWGSKHVTDAQLQRELLDFASAKGVNRLFVEAWSALVHEPAILADFVVTSRSRGIEVELLFGQPDWARTEEHYVVENIVEQVIDFSQRYPEAKPDGIHIDVEPYLLPEWESDRNAIANEMVDLFEKIRARAAPEGLALRTDIPIWFDQHYITRNGESRLLHELVIDATHGVGLMDYRDTKERIIADALDELDYALATGKEVVVGVETLCIEPKSITFCEEGSDFMEQVLRELDVDLQSYKSYTGHAIHHLDSYRTLKR